MILNSLETHEHAFLILDYPDMDFIVNRDQIFASLFLEETAFFESGLLYFPASMEYYEHRLPVFELDLFLKHTFTCKIESLVKFALICELSCFSPENQAVYQAQMLHAHPDFSSDYIAFKVSSHAKIRPVPLAEISLLPEGIRLKQNKEGILGCRFPAQANMQYFLDIETILFNCLSVEPPGENDEV